MFRPTFLAPRYLFVLFLILGIGLRILAIAHTDPYKLGDVTLGKPLIDDSYYYLSLGRNLATGVGLRIDADYVTTGFQPLWGFIVAIPFMLFPQDATSPLHGVQVIGAGVGVLSYLALVRLGTRMSASAWWAVLIAGLWFISPQSVRHTVSAMETSLSLLLLIVVFDKLWQVYQSPQTHALYALGLWMGLAILARVDSLLLAGLIALALYWYPPQASSWLQRLRQILPYGIMVLVVLVPWMVLSLALGKSPYPESGTAVQALGRLAANLPTQLSLSQWFQDEGVLTFVLTNLILFITWFLNQVDYFGLVTWLFSSPFVSLLIKLMAGLMVTMLIQRQARQRLPYVFQVMLKLYAVWGVLMSLAYIWIGASWFYGRYSLPLAELFMLGSLGVLASLRQSTWARRVLAGLCLAMVLSHGFLYSQSDTYHWIVNSQYSHANDGFYDALQWLETERQADEGVASFQTGLIGYFASFPVTNLDGKVNHEARQALLSGTTWEYMCQKGIVYQVDWASFITFFRPALSAGQSLETWHAERFEPIAEFPSQISQPLVVYRVKCPTTSANNPN